MKKQRIDEIRAFGANVKLDIQSDLLWFESNVLATCTRNHNSTLDAFGKKYTQYYGCRDDAYFSLCGRTGTIGDGDGKSIWVWCEVYDVAWRQNVGHVIAESAECCCYFDGREKDRAEITHH